MLAAVRRAGDEFVWRQAKRALSAAAALGLFYSLLGLVDDGPDAEPLRLSLLGAVGLGALLCQAIGQLAVSVAPRASSHVAAAMVRATHSHGMAVGLRGAAAIGLVSAALGLLASGSTLLLLPFGSFQVFQKYAPLVSWGLGLGAVCSALWSQVTGGALHCAGQAGRRQPLLPELSERFEVNVKNPTLILDLVGNHVGVTATRAQDAFCTVVMLHAATISLALWVWRDGSPPPFTVFAYPVLIQAFGLFAAAVTIFSARADESDEPTLVLWRAQLAMAAISVASLAGLCTWLFDDAWLPWFATSATGVGASLLVVFFRQQLVDRRRVGLKDQRDSAGISSLIHISRGVAAGTASAWPGLLALGACIAIAAQLANDAGPMGAPFATAIALCGFAMNVPYVASLAIFDPIVDGGCAMATLDPRRRPDLRTRAIRLEQAALSAGTVGRGQLVMFNAALGVLCTLLLGHFRDGVQHAGLPAAPALAWAGGLCGLLATLSLSGVGLKHIATVASRTALDVQRQLQGFARDGNGITELPEDFRPRYADHLSAACGRALQARSMTVLLALLLVPCMVVLVGLSSSSLPEGLGLPLVWFIAFSTAATLALGLGADAVWSLLSAARRQAHPKPGPQLCSLNLADGLGEFAANAVSPTLALVFKSLLAAGLLTSLTLL